MNEQPGLPGPPGPHAPRSQTSLKEYAMAAPHLLKLLGRLLRDPRVPARSKAVFVFTIGYLVSPIDALPDFLPGGVGRVDDIVLIAFALDQILNRIEPDIVREHWDGNEDVLELVQHILEIGASLLPRWAKRLMPKQ